MMEQIVEEVENVQSLPLGRGFRRFAVLVGERAGQGDQVLGPNPDSIRRRDDVVEKP